MIVVLFQLPEECKESFTELQVHLSSVLDELCMTYVKQLDLVEPVKSVDQELNKYVMVDTTGHLEGLYFVIRSAFPLGLYFQLNLSFFIYNIVSASSYSLH